MALIPRQFVPADTTGSTAIVIVSWIFPVLATIAVSGRFLARRLRKSDYRLDDWLILAALVPLWGHTAVILSSVYLGGIGHHQATLHPENAVVLYKTLTALQFSFGVSLGLTKASIILLLMRIFFTRTFKIAARIVLAYCLCWMLMAILIGACMCRPFAKNWNPLLDGKCGDRIPAYIAIAALDIVGDLLILALPMPMIWRLHSTTANKIGLSVVFALGFLDIIVGILRIIYLVALNTAKDYTWTAVNCWIWSVLEPSLAILVACGPTLGPFVTAFFGHLGSLRGSSKQQTSYPERSERRQQFSNISDSEYPLKPVYGNSSTAYSKGAATAPGVDASAGPDSLDRNVHLKDEQRIDEVPGINVQTDTSVMFSPRDIAFERV